MVRESFVFFKSFWEAIQEIPDDKDKLDCFMLIVKYGLNSEDEPSIKGLPRAIFSMAKPVIDNAVKRYDTSVENGKKGGRPKEDKEPNKNLKKPNHNLGVSVGLNLKEPDHNLNDNVNVNENDNVNDNDNVNVNENENEKIKEDAPKGHTRKQAFHPPTANEVRMYCAERGNKVDVDRFIDFYTSKGWMVGKNKMKDWRACVRTWEKQDAEIGASAHKKSFGAAGNVFANIATEGDELL